MFFREYGIKVTGMKSLSQRRRFLRRHMALSLALILVHLTASTFLGESPKPMWSHLCKSLKILKISKNSPDLQESMLRSVTIFKGFIVKIVKDLQEFQDFLKSSRTFVYLQELRSVISLKEFIFNIVKDLQDLQKWLYMGTQTNIWAQIEACLLCRSIGGDPGRLLLLRQFREALLLDEPWIFVHPVVSPELLQLPQNELPVHQPPLVLQRPPDPSELSRLLNHRRAPSDHSNYRQAKFYNNFVLFSYFGLFKKRSCFLYFFKINHKLLIIKDKKL